MHTTARSFLYQRENNQSCADVRSVDQIALDIVDIAKKILRGQLRVGGGNGVGILV
jgi:hypothetical protein